MFRSARQINFAHKTISAIELYGYENDTDI